MQIAIVDDDPMFRAAVEYMLRGVGWDVVTAEDEAGALNLLKVGEPRAVLLDWQLGEADGLTVMRRLHEVSPSVPVILVTATVSTDLAVRAVKSGAFDFLTKPVDAARLLTCVDRAAEHGRLLGRVTQLENNGGSEESEFEGMLGRSAAMRTVFRVIRTVAPTEVSILITGETGTGKELTARAVHRRSLRAAGPFVPLNMAAIPRELIEATLFGHERGSFTGAERRRAGAFEEAAGGTLFLDEIGEMPAELQSKLLRVLQERSFRRVGGTEDLPADVRVVSATNRDPLAEVKAGGLRADLYYRLNVVPIELPALRERGEDRVFLATSLLREMSRKHGRAFTCFEPEALEAIGSYDWPGNVRELRHLVERVVVLNDGETATLAMLPPEVRRACVPAADGEPTPFLRRRSDVGLTGEHAAPETVVSEPVIPLAELERRAIVHALRVSDGSVQSAATRLGTSSATLYRRIREFKIDAPRPVGSRGD